MADSSALQTLLFDGLRQHFAEASIAGGTDVANPRDSPRVLDMTSPHRVHERRVTITKDEHVARDPVRFEVTRQPQHPATRAPVAGSAADNEGIKSEAIHYSAHRPIPTPVLPVGETVVDRVVMPPRVCDVRECLSLVEALSHAGEVGRCHQFLPKCRPAGVVGGGLPPRGGPKGKRFDKKKT